MSNEAAANAVSPETVSDSVQPSTDLNDPGNWDFDDETEENPSNAAASESGIDPEREPDESAEAAQESEESGQDTKTESSDEGDESAAVELEVPDNALVTLANGEKVRFSDLKKAPMFEKDYRHKTQELGNQRRAVTENATRLQALTEAFVDHLSSQIPEEPSPQLALSDPSEYVRRRAVYDAAMASIQGLVEQASGAKSVVKELTDAERANAIREANAELESRLPHIRDAAKRKEFNQQTWDTARHFGFSPEELGANLDYRLLWMGHYAQKGLRAEAAERKVAQKVKQAPQVTPARKAATKGNPDFLRNKEAMRRLQNSGSFSDAMQIDFD